MSLGFEQAGFDIVAAIESDPAHAAVHRFNFPRCIVIQADAADVSLARLRRAVDLGLRRHRRSPDASVDVVFGGPPCQGFSVGGLLNPNDPRNRLVEQFVRLVLALKPRSFVLENVPAMASRALPGESCTVPEWLAVRMGRAGYDVAEPMTLNASGYGVPQDRRRLLIVGALRPFAPLRAPAERVVPRPKRPPHSPPRRGPCNCETENLLPAGPTVTDALAGLPNLDDFPELLRSDVARLAAQEREALLAHESAYARALVLGQMDEADLSWPRRRTPSLLTSSLRTVHAEPVVERFGNVAVGDREPISRFVRLHPGGISPTLRAGSTPDRGSFSAPRPIHPIYDRVISVREAARLQGFPDWFRFSSAKWHGFRQVGNSVCPPVARAVAEVLRETLELSALAPTERLGLGDPALLRVASGAGRSAAKATYDADRRGERDTELEVAA
jgi:DNA (cytosine-5)-methyltransferase 1